MIRVLGYSGENISLKLSDLRHGCFLTLGTEFLPQSSLRWTCPTGAFPPRFPIKIGVSQRQHWAAFVGFLSFPRGRFSVSWRGGEHEYYTNVE
jgi:hypothetical protein